MKCAACGETDHERDEHFDHVRASQRARKLAAEGRLIEARNWLRNAELLRHNAALRARAGLGRIGGMQAISRGGRSL